MLTIYQLSVTEDEWNDAPVVLGLFTTYEKASEACTTYAVRYPDYAQFSIYPVHVW